MKDRNQHARQLWGCGYEPPLPEHMRNDPRYLTPWEHEGRKPHADEPRVCAGYVCALPEVIEASHAAAWKKDGELTQFLEGAMCTPDLRHAITLLEIEQSRVLAFAAKESTK